MISSTTSKVQYLLSSTTETLAVPFYFLESSHLKVIKTVDDVQTVLSIGTHYTVTGAGVMAGGSITLTGTAVALDDTVTIKRSVPLTQLVDYLYNDRFPAETHEKALDKLTMICQLLQEQAERSLRFEDGEVLDGTLPLADRLGMLLKFDETTGGVTFVDPQAIIDGAAAAAAASAATAAAAAASASASAAAAFASETAAAASEVSAAASAAAAAADAEVVAGASPSASASANVAAIQAALNNGGIVKINAPGDYLLNATLVLKSNTILILSPGVTLKKTGSYYYMFKNEHAGSEQSSVDSNIAIIGGTLDLNDIDPGGNFITALPIPGMSGHLSFRNLDRLIIRSVKIINCASAMTMVHLARVSNYEVTQSSFEGNKDGIHNSGFVENGWVHQCQFQTGDDWNAQNAWDYIGYSPQLGTIKNIVYSQCTSIGYSCRAALPGSWSAWTTATSYGFADTVRSAGYQYRKINAGTVVSSVAPSHTAFGTDVTGADGIEWRCCGASSDLAAEVLDVRYVDCVGTGAYALTANNDANGRSEFPGATKGRIAGIKLERCAFHESVVSEDVQIVNVTAQTESLEFDSLILDPNIMPLALAIVGAPIGKCLIRGLKTYTWPSNVLLKGTLYMNGGSVTELVYEDCDVSGLAAFGSLDGILIKGAGIGTITVRGGYYDNITSLFQSSADWSPFINITGATFNNVNRIAYFTNGVGTPRVNITNCKFISAPVTGLIGTTTAGMKPIAIIADNVGLAAATLFSETTGGCRAEYADMPVSKATVSAPEMIAGDRIKTSTGMSVWNGTRWIDTDFWYPSPFVSLLIGVRPTNDNIANIVMNPRLPTANRGWSVDAKDDGGAGREFSFYDFPGAAYRFKITPTGIQVMGGTTPLLTSMTAITSGAGANTATMTNSPVTGNPTSWIRISDNGTTRYIPAW